MPDQTVDDVTVDRKSAVAPAGPGAPEPVPKLPNPVVPTRSPKVPPEIPEERGHLVQEQSPRGCRRSPGGNRQPVATILPMLGAEWLQFPATPRGKEVGPAPTASAVGGDWMPGGTWRMRQKGEGCRGSPGPRPRSFSRAVLGVPRSILVFRHL